MLAPCLSTPYNHRPRPKHRMRRASHPPTKNERPKAVLRNRCLSQRKRVGAGSAEKLKRLFDQDEWDVASQQFAGVQWLESILKQAGQLPGDGYIVSRRTRTHLSKGGQLSAVPYSRSRKRCSAAS
jgi:hypothetical protein